jgi:hypothetical protein
MEVLLEAIEKTEIDLTATIATDDRNPFSVNYISLASGDVPSSYSNSNSNPAFSLLNTKERNTIVQNIWQSDVLLEICTVNKAMNDVLVKKRGYVDDRAASAHHVQIESLLEYYAIQDGTFD